MTRDIIKLAQEPERRPSLPKTAEEVRAFLGRDFFSAKTDFDGQASDDDQYGVTAHDLLSAFARLADEVVQEPVGWRFRKATFFDRSAPWHFVESLEGTEGLQGLEPLYTAPQPREWVGLTDEEKSDLWCESTGRDCVNEDTHVFADAIEAKLREKNA